MQNVKFLFFYTLEGAGLGCEATGITAWEVENPKEIWKNKVANNDLWEMACQNAESYGVYPMPDELDEDEDEEQYSEDISGHAVPLNPEQHSCRLSGGGDWRDHIDEKGYPYLHESGFWALDDSPEGIEKARVEAEDRNLGKALRDCNTELEYLERQLAPLLKKKALIEERRDAIKEKMEK